MDKIYSLFCWIISGVVNVFSSSFFSASVSIYKEHIKALIYDISSQYNLRGNSYEQSNSNAHKHTHKWMRFVLEMEIQLIIFILFTLTWCMSLMNVILSFILITDFLFNILFFILLLFKDIIIKYNKQWEHLSKQTKQNNKKKDIWNHQS